MIEQAELRPQHVEERQDREARRIRAARGVQRVRRRRASAAVAATDDIRADHKVAVRVDGLAWADEGLPPAGRRMARRRGGVARGGQARVQQNGIVGRMRERAPSLVGNVEARQLAAVVERHALLAGERLVAARRTVHRLRAAVDGRRRGRRRLQRRALGQQACRARLVGIHAGERGGREGAPRSNVRGDSQTSPLRRSGAGEERALCATGRRHLAGEHQLAGRRRSARQGCSDVGTAEPHVCEREEMGAVQWCSAKARPSWRALLCRTEGMEGDGGRDGPYGREDRPRRGAAAGDGMGAARHPHPAAAAAARAQRGCAECHPCLHHSNSRKPPIPILLVPAQHSPLRRSTQTALLAPTPAALWPRTGPPLSEHPRRLPHRRERAARGGLLFLPAQAGRAPQAEA
jgi:hypothetical protein